MASLVDTNVLVYRCDPRFPAKMRRAEEVLRRGAADGSLLVPHQALLEFVAATTRARGQRPLLGLAQALEFVEEFMETYEVLLPTQEVVRAAFLGATVHGLPWYDAHLWAYAAVNGIPEILTEDLPGKRVCGAVRYVDPFAGA